MKMPDLPALRQLLKDTYAAWSEDNVLRLSAALAYYAIFSIAPLLVIAVAIAGFILGPKAVSGHLGDQLSGTMGQPAAEAIQSMVQTAAQPADNFWAALVGFATLFLGATGVFAQLKDALNTIWGVRAKSAGGIMGFVRERLLSFSMVLVIGFLLLTSLFLTTALAAVTKHVGGILPIHPLIIGVLNFLLSLAIATVLFALIFKVLPDVSVQWHNVWIGALFTAVLFEIGKFLLAFYLGRESTASSYGAAGSVILVLLWIYYTSVILFSGAEFTRVHAREMGTTIVPEGNVEPVTQEMRAEEGLPPADKPVADTPPPPAAPARPVRVHLPAPARSPQASAIPTLAAGVAAGIAVALVTRVFEARLRG